MELFENIGFKKNPFSTFTAEKEMDFLEKVFIKPRNYKSLKSDVVDNNSSFIIGARGVGKTALILSLKDDLEKENVFCLFIDDFDGIPVKNNKAEFLKNIIEKLIKSYCVALSNSPFLLKKLDKYDKEKLAFIISEFFHSLSKSELETYYNKATKYKTRNTFKKIFNNVFNKPINLLIAGSIEIVSDSVRKSLSLPVPNSTTHYKNYFPEFKLEEIESDKKSNVFLKDPTALKSILEDLSKIINKSGFKSTSILIDRADEYTKLGFGIEAVCVFLMELLSDTTILLNSNYSFVIGIWDAMKSTLDSYKVRFDKIKPLDINWDEEFLEKILLRRIEYFSDNNVKLSELLTTEAKKKVLQLSNNSPRYLFRQLSVIYDEQNNVDSNAKSFSNQIVEAGQLNYCKNFEFYAVFPTKKGTKEDVVININRLLKINKLTIRTKDFVDVFKVSTPTAISYIKILQDYGLVTNLGGNNYDVINPIIRHLIMNSVKQIKN